MISFTTSTPESDFENCYIQTVIENGNAFYKVYANKDLSGNALYLGQYGNLSR